MSLRNERPDSQPSKSTGTTHDWPQKYSKHSQGSKDGGVNWRRKPEPTRLQRNIRKVLRFALMPLRFAAYIVLNKPGGDIKQDKLLHRQTRYTPRQWR